MAIETDQIVLRNGLRILAHIIARAYLKDMRSRQSELTNSEGKVKEDNDNGERGRVQAARSRIATRTGTQAEKREMT